MAGEGLTGAATHRAEVRVVAVEDAVTVVVLVDRASDVCQQPAGLEHFERCTREGRTHLVPPNKSMLSCAGEWPVDRGETPFFERVIVTNRSGRMKSFGGQKLPMPVSSNNPSQTLI